MPRILLTTALPAAGALCADPWDGVRAGLGSQKVLNSLGQRARTGGETTLAPA